MPAVRAMAFFCEDVREELAGTHSVIGVLPDNINMPLVPGMMPKLGLYVRLMVEPHAAIGPLAILLVFPNGHEQEVNKLEGAVIEKAQKEAEAAGLPFGGVVAKVVMSPFPILAFGRIKAVLRGSDGDTLCATLNFQKEATSTTAPAPPV